MPTLSRRQRIARQRERDGDGSFLSDSVMVVVSDQNNASLEVDFDTRHIDEAKESDIERDSCNDTCDSDSDSDHVE